MKIGFGKEKLKDVHPLVIAFLYEEGQSKRFESISIETVRIEPVNELNTKATISFRAGFKGTWKKTPNGRSLKMHEHILFAQHAKDFSCSNMHITKVKS